MARTQTLVQLTDELVAALDQRAASRGRSRSQIIRQAIEAFLREELDAEIARRYRDAYERQPQAEPDPWADAMLEEGMKREAW